MSRWNPAGPLTDEQKRLAEANYPLAKLFLKRIAPGRHPMEQERIATALDLALIDTARNFDPAKGRFSTYFRHAFLSRLKRLRADDRPKGYRRTNRPGCPVQVPIRSRAVDRALIVWPDRYPGQSVDESLAWSAMDTVLDPVERAVVKLRLIDGKVFREIGDAVGYKDKHGPRECFFRAIRKLRDHFGVNSD